MPEQELYTRLLCLLQAELEALRAISALQTQVGVAARAGQWADYDSLMEALQGQGAKLGALEQERAALTQNVKAATEDIRFYSFVVRFNAGARQELTGQYRALKLELARVRAANDALAGFLNVQLSLVNGMLSAAFPDRRGTLYGRYGKARTADMRSVVLNRAF